MNFFCVCLMCICCFSLEAQKDSIAVQKPLRDTLHSPTKAAIFSAILPGAGQIYNHLAMPRGHKKAFWKVPLIYAGLGLTAYFAFSSQQQVKSIETEYDHRNNGGTLNPTWGQYDASGLITLHDKYAKRRDLSILTLGIVYLLQVVDASIEAHFVNFDISENLSMNIEPTYFGNQSLGLRLNLHFH